MLHPPLHLSMQKCTTLYKRIIFSDVAFKNTLLYVHRFINLCIHDVFRHFWHSRDRQIPPSAAFRPTLHHRTFVGTHYLPLLHVHVPMGTLALELSDT